MKKRQKVARQLKKRSISCVDSSSDCETIFYSPSSKHHCASTSMALSPSSPTAEDRRHTFEAKAQQRESFELLYEFYRNGEFCDIEVRCGNTTIKCHRVILACVSKYFRSMFQAEYVESRQSCITIKDIDENAMKSIIEFAYTSKISMDVDEVQTLLYAVINTARRGSRCCVL